MINLHIHDLYDNVIVTEYSIKTGMEYPFSSDSLQAIRISSCRYITWMYKRRKLKIV